MGILGRVVQNKRAKSGLRGVLTATRGARPALGVLRRIGGTALGGIGGLTLPLDVAALLDTNSGQFSRTMNNREAQRENLLGVPDTLEEVAGASEDAGLSSALRSGAAGVEGFEHLRRAGLRTQQSMSLDELINEDRGLLGQISQQSPPSLAELYASAGII